MKDNKVQIDTGCDILTLESYNARGTAIVTAYVNGISIRSGSLHLERVAGSFCDTVLTACQIEDSKTNSKVANEIEAFINDTIQ